MWFEARLTPAFFLDSRNGGLEKTFRPPASVPGDLQSGERGNMVRPGGSLKAGLKLDSRLLKERLGVLRLAEPVGWSIGWFDIVVYCECVMGERRKIAEYRVRL